MSNLSVCVVHRSLLRIVGNQFCAGNISIFHGIFGDLGILRRNGNLISVVVPCCVYDLYKAGSRIIGRIDANIVLRIDLRISSKLQEARQAYAVGKGVVIIAFISFFIVQVNCRSIARNGAAGDFRRCVKSHIQSAALTLCCSCRYRAVLADLSTGHRKHGIIADIDTAAGTANGLVFKNAAIRQFEPGVPEIHAAAGLCLIFTYVTTGNFRVRCLIQENTAAKGIGRFVLRNAAAADFQMGLGIIQGDSTAIGGSGGIVCNGAVLNIDGDVLRKALSVPLRKAQNGTAHLFRAVAGDCASRHREGYLVRVNGVLPGQTALLLIIRDINSAAVDAGSRGLR